MSKSGSGETGDGISVAPECAWTVSFCREIIALVEGTDDGSVEVARVVRGVVRAKLSMSSVTPATAPGSGEVAESLGLSATG